MVEQKDLGKERLSQSYQRWRKRELHVLEKEGAWVVNE